MSMPAQPTARTASDHCAATLMNNKLDLHTECCESVSLNNCMNSFERQLLPNIPSSAKIAMYPEHNMYAFDFRSSDSEQNMTEKTVWRDTGMGLLILQPRNSNNS